MSDEDYDYQKEVEKAEATDEKQEYFPRFPKFCSLCHLALKDGEKYMCQKCKENPMWSFIEYYGKKPLGN